MMDEGLWLGAIGLGLAVFVFVGALWASRRGSSLLGPP